MTEPKRPAPPASYRALLAVPSLGRALAGMQIARIAQSMVGLALVLFTLEHYHSPELAGLVTFAGIAPGILVSPIAGALLDRHGRTRLITLDFVIAAASLALIGALALADLLPAWLLVAIAAVSALTGPLSATGLRSLFPLMAPRHLWERLNAIDSNGYVVATIIGPPVAAVAVTVLGGPWALVILGASYAVAAAIVFGVPDPATETATTGNLLRDAWDGVRYTWGNRTLRGLGFSITTLNLAGGMGTIVIPLIVLNRLGLGQTAVGLVFAVQGVVGLVAGLIAGRMDTRGRERGLIVLPMFGFAIGVALLLPDAGIVPVILSMAVLGLVNGPMDVAMFTVRQRRTDPAWMGRAFAVSMSFNFAGYPIGSAISGFVAARSIELAVGLGVVACLVAGFLAWRLIPESAPET
ncbi:MAG TPA: MFS transporter [Candidatus Acidoferrales bacterium]|nr:MFS transporter [Candidatus Acidoferrales bacterium]